MKLSGHWVPGAWGMGEVYRWLAAPPGMGGKVTDPVQATDDTDYTDLFVLLIRDIRAIRGFPFEDQKLRFRDMRDARLEIDDARTRRAQSNRAGRRESNATVADGTASPISVILNWNPKRP